MKLSSARVTRDGISNLFLIKLGVCLAIAVVFLVNYFPVAARQQPQASEFFEKQVRPILAANCQTCHNAKTKVSGLDLSSSEGFARGGEGGPVFDRARPDESRLIRVIGYGEELKMPPSGRLQDEEIRILTDWIRMGAPWPVAEAIAAPRASGASPALSAGDKAFWSFQPMVDPQPPQVKDSQWIASPIDRFILARLEKQGLTPVPAADRLTLLRRATYDLTGLPPSEPEILAFLADQSPDAFSKVVERLLASRRYGEHWGRHWLDVARYADSTGNDEDHRYPHAWRYRDWVIDAFNRDLPYDRFVREQIAGDLLEAEGDDSASGVNRSGIIATGFLALGPKALAQQDKTKMLYDVYDEQVDVTTKAFLGLTVACARCHDHKFDPISTKDYYSLVSIFSSTRSFKDPNVFVSEPLNRPLVVKSEFEKYLAAKRAYDERIKRTRYAIEAIVETAKDPAAWEAGMRLSEIMLAARRVYLEGAVEAVEARKAGLSEDALKKWIAYLKPGKPREHLLAWHNAPSEKVPGVAREYQARFENSLSEWTQKVGKWRNKYQEALALGKSPLPEKPAFEAGNDRFFAEVYFGKEGPLAVAETDEAVFSLEAREELKKLRTERDALKKQAPVEPDMACAVEDGEIVNQKVFIRGDYHNPGEGVPKGFPRILTETMRERDVQGGSGRRQLAQWITKPEHPLTARVMVNRIWGWHFGDGLVRTTDNFGRMGEQPTHPELLDYLARQFIRSGWSVKALHRMIMLSSAYQMSSLPSDSSLTKDPDNRLLSHFNRRRLSVEEMRDGLLAIDGSLDLQMGGTLQSGTGTDGENDNKRLSLNPERLNRRTVYLPLRRANLPALLNLFDFGDATTVNGKRQLTNVATQALFWLNSEFLAERSQNLARSLLAGKTTDDAQIVRRAYLRILNRRPSPDEVASARKYLAGYRAKFVRGKKRLDAWASLSRVLMATNDFNYVD
jgi:uncharacterized protein DUF1553/uncharacterized protein DUF1549/cytochrome c